MSQQIGALLIHAGVEGDLPLNVGFQIRGLATYAADSAGWQSRGTCNLSLLPAAVAQGENSVAVSAGQSAGSRTPGYVCNLGALTIKVDTATPTGCILDVESNTSGEDIVMTFYAHD